MPKERKKKKKKPVPKDTPASFFFFFMDLRVWEVSRLLLLLADSASKKH